MSNLIDISSLHKQFKSEAEKQVFIEKLYEQVVNLNAQLKSKEEEISHLKTLLAGTTPLLEDSGVERMIVTPEQALVDGQIAIIKGKGFGTELSLEDVKKLDILIKNKRLLDEEGRTLKGKSKTISVSNASLLDIIKNEQS